MESNSIVQYPVPVANMGQQPFFNTQHNQWLPYKIQAAYDNNQVPLPSTQINQWTPERTQSQFSNHDTAHQNHQLPLPSTQINQWTQQRTQPQLSIHDTLYQNHQNPSLPNTTNQTPNLFSTPNTTVIHHSDLPKIIQGLEYISFPSPTYRLPHESEEPYIHLNIKESTYTHLQHSHSIISGTRPIRIRLTTYENQVFTWTLGAGRKVLPGGKWEDVEVSGDKDPLVLRDLIVMRSTGLGELLRDCGIGKKGNGGVRIRCFVGRDRVEGERAFLLPGIPERWGREGFGDGVEWVRGEKSVGDGLKGDVGVKEEVGVEGDDGVKGHHGLKIDFGVKGFGGGGVERPLAIAIEKGPEEGNIVKDDGHNLKKTAAGYRPNHVESGAKGGKGGKGNGIISGKVAKSKMNNKIVGSAGVQKGKKGKGGRPTWRELEQRVLQLEAYMRKNLRS